jgi:peptidoglycan/xylan/chitin deacetylase (PgdA/CDA1 family)
MHGRESGRKAAIRHTGLAGAIALTFDDGPNPVVTPGLLELFARHQVAATFFVIGQHVRTNPSLLREIAAAGHTVGNHTDSHLRLPFVSPERARYELSLCSASIADVCGRRPRFMRPPYGLPRRGLRDMAAAEGIGAVVMWSRAALDWWPQPAWRVLRRLQRVRSGDIVLLHDGAPEPAADRRHTLQSLTEMIPVWLDAGLRFVSLDQVRP